MYARLTTFPMRPESRARVEPIASKYAGILAQQPGHRSTTFCFDEAGTEFVSLSVWESRAQAEAVTAAVRDAAQREMGDLISGAPSTKILEVFEPR